ncbi:AAA family ATPase [Paractinoplanes maris]|uniref:AAA family ATPase n=1 Tax=Paractinoplanes maris TaxID=1734446 RepID=UPI00201FE059|nr:LuxR family transcriptional regulator [Actinoplanes maris]
MTGPTSVRLGEPVGRVHECRLLDAAVDGLDRRGTALLLWGDPGVGKTTLLDHVARRAGTRVLRARGVESEAVLPYATLADLLIPLRAHFGALPAVRRDALEGALALSDKEAFPYAVCTAALAVLAAAGETAPLILLVDDLHWVDQPSRQVLLFVARRLDSERLLLIMAGRDDTELRGRCDVPALHLAGLTRPDCLRLLRAHDLRPVPGVLDDLVERTGGNPLALLEWVAATEPDRTAGDPAGAGSLSLGRRLESGWLAQVEQLPGPARAALTVLASSGSSAISLLAPALAGRGLTLGDLAPAEAAEILIAQGDRYEFRHPLLRSAVLRSSSLADRRAAYDALAAVTSGPARTWYRASAAAGPDAAVAAELADAAREARRRSGYDSAALACHRAAQLSPHPAERAGLLRDAAADSFRAGASARAAAWCDEALAAAGDPLLRADIELLRGRIHTWLGHTTAARDGLVAAAGAVRDLDPARAGALLSEATLPAGMDGRVPEQLRLGAEAVALSPTPRNVVLNSLSLMIDGQVEVAHRGLESAAGFLGPADPVGEQHLLALVGQSLLLGERETAGQMLLNQVIEAARIHAAPVVLPIALAFRSDAEYWSGRWAESQADATESLHWAEELGYTSALGFIMALLGRLDAQRGETSRCAARISRGRREAGPYRIGSLEGYYTDALGLAALASGDYEDAVTQLDRTFRISRRGGLGNPRVIPFAADLVESHVRAGRPERAAEPLRWLAGVADRTGLTWPAAALARCRGLLATTCAEAETHFAEAEQLHKQREHPYEAARTLLCRGEALRRFRRPAAARIPLTAAHACFESLGAVPWARRAAAELAAAGRRTPPSAGPPVLDLLSPQEVQVARAIAGGMNNAEAAGVLFISRKTVEAHLTRVYRKLGVRSRTDLTRALVLAGLVR